MEERIQTFTNLNDGDKRELIYHYKHKHIYRIGDYCMIIDKHDDCFETYVDALIQCQGIQYAPKYINHASFDGWCALITSFIEGVNLDDLWESLDSNQKEKIKKDLVNMKNEMSKIPPSPPPWVFTDKLLDDLCISATYASTKEFIEMRHMMIEKYIIYRRPNLKKHLKQNKRNVY